MQLVAYTGAELNSLLFELEPAYAAAFAGPPYSYGPDRVARAIRGLTFASAQPQARAAVARRDGVAVGAAWGWVTPAGLAEPDSPFRDLYERIGYAVGGPELAEPLLAGRVEVVELFVHPAAQGAGVGRQLLELLVDGRPGWLVSWPTAPAYSAYLRWGWTDRARLVDGSGAELSVMTVDAVPAG